MWCWACSRTSACRSTSSRTSTSRWWWCTTDYPGASPEIVESEVTKKIEEGVNSIAGINALTSRSYEGQSVVIIEFQLYVDGRKAADDVREKVAAVRPLFATR